MSPADQAWATKGGGKPDLTDPYIAARAPNKFKPKAAAPAAAPAAALPAAGASVTAESVELQAMLRIAGLR